MLWHLLLIAVAVGSAVLWARNAVKCWQRGLRAEAALHLVLAAVVLVILVLAVR